MHQKLAKAINYDLLTADLNLAFNIFLLFDIC